MLPHISPKVVVVRRAEKSAKLETFIREHMACLPGPGITLCRLVAYSGDSPVVTALSTVAREIGSNRIHVLAVMARIDRMLDEALFAACKVRWAQDPRLREAHEQLLLGEETSWIGDSMRREPGKHDSYECYAPNCPASARWTRVAFERLWVGSQPVAGSRDL